MVHVGFIKQEQIVQFHHFRLRFKIRDGATIPDGQEQQEQEPESRVIHIRTFDIQSALPPAAAAAPVPRPPGPIECKHIITKFNQAPPQRRRGRRGASAGVFSVFTLYCICVCVCM